MRLNSIGTKFSTFLTLAIVFLLPSLQQPVFSQENLPVSFDPLPFAQDALEPFISSHTLGFHYGKHHATYVSTANSLLKGNPLAEKSVEEIIKATAGKNNQSLLFNAVSQSWNHAFFWKCLKPKSTGQPTGKLATMINEQFGNFTTFSEEFLKAGKSIFGSGWVWLVLDEGKLKIVTTSNAGNPLADGPKPLFVIDAWEHSYYLDYQNRRPEYLKAVLENLVNWEFIASNL